MKRQSIPMITLLVFFMAFLTRPHPLQAADASPTPASDPTRVLVLYSYNFNQKAQQTIAQGIEMARQTAGMDAINFVHEFLDISPPKTPEQRQMVKELLLSKYRDTNFGLIITVFNEALTFLIDDCGDLSPGSSCLALYGQERPGLMRGGKPVQQSPLYFDVAGTLSLLTTLLPDTRHVMIVTGDNAIDHAFETKARADSGAFQERLTFEYTGHTPVDKIYEKSAGLSPGSVVIYAFVSSDITGRKFNPRDVAIRLVNTSTVPVFCLATSLLDTGVIGGSMVDVDGLSKMLGTFLLSLKHHEPKPIQPASNFVRPMVDWRQIERWGIPAGRIPENSIVINRPQTLWSQYRFEVLTTFLAFLGLVGLLGLLMVQNQRRRFAETSALFSEARYRVLTEQAPDAITVYDVRTDRFMDANPSAVKLFGCSREELIRSGPRRFYVDKQPDGQIVDTSFTNHIRRALSGEKVRFERAIRSLDGKDLICDVTAALIPPETEHLVRLSYTDITERKAMETALRLSEEKYRVLTENMRDVVWVLDTDTLRFLYVSPSVKAVRGFTAEEIMAEPFAEALPTHKRDSVIRLVRQRSQEILTTGKTKKPYYVTEVEQPCKNGSTIWTEVITQYYLNRKTSHVEVLGVTRDISERKQAETEHQTLQNQLIQAQKMESVGRLAGGVAHDFNNMLGVILGHIEMLMEEMDPSLAMFSDLGEIRKAAEHSASLTRQLLAFARKQIAEPRILDLNITVEGMLRMLSRLIGEDIELTWLPGRNVSPVFMDPSQIDQILANLCVNARDAIEDVGRVSIETKMAWFDPEFCEKNPDYLPGDFVMLAVSDNGCGMDNETRTRIFEPFYTTKSQGQGTGLGLAMVYGIMKQNNGFITVYSEPGKGTTFRLYLPARASDAVKDVGRTSSSPPVRGDETILLVEDEPAILKMTAMMLKDLGYTVLTASDPFDAIQSAKKHGHSISLLITDVVMPDMNGRDLADTIRTFHPRLKCLYTSGYTADIIAHHGVLDTGIHFIQKPFSKKNLSEKIRAAIDTP